MKIYTNKKAVFFHFIFIVPLLIGTQVGWSTPLPQDKTITGVVKDAEGTTLPNVNIIIKGTTVGTTSDLDGKYSIRVPDNNSVLQFIYIGFTTQELAVGNSSVINVTMSENLQLLKEIVVVGYGVQAKKDITGSVAVVKAEELQQRPASNFGTQMQGRAAGVNIQTGGFAAGGTSVRIRGIGSVNDNGPLYVIDGVSTRNQDLNTINPNDIESMQILKDASSASIYGAQSSSGVIIITTKKGKKGDRRANISYDGFYGVRSSGKFHDLMNTQQFADYLWERQLNNIRIRDIRDNQGNLKQPIHAQFGEGPVPVIPDYIIPAGYTGNDPGTWTPDNRITRISHGTNWWKAVTRTGQTQSHQLSLTGGGEAGRYSLGANYFNEQGIVIGEFFRRFAVRTNSEYNVRKNIRIGENLAVSFTQSSYRGNQTEASPLAFSYRMVPFIPVYDIAGNFAGTGAKGAGNGKNPVANATRSKDDRNLSSRVFGNMYAEIDFIEGLTFRTNIGIDYTNYNGYWMEKKQPEPSEPSPNNTFTENGGYNLRWVFTNTLTYEHQFAGKHMIKVLLGAESLMDGIGRGWEASRQGYFLEDNTNTWTLANGTSNIKNNSWFNDKYAITGFFARVDYDYDQRYLLTANIRRDGVSRFKKDMRWGTFAAVSGGWRVSNEAFMKELRWLSDLKLRVGYGATGNADIPRPFNYAYEYAQTLANGYDLGGTSNSTYTGIMLSKYGNPSTRWETSQMTNFGIDFGILNNSLNFNIEYYIKHTKDMLVQDNHSAFSGVGDAPYVNIGKMKNTGIDFSMNYHGGNKDFIWQVAGTLSTYQNKVISLTSDKQYRLWGAGSRIGDLAVTQAGFPISQFYGYKIDGIFQNEAEVMAAPYQTGMEVDRSKPHLMVGKYRYADINHDGVIDQNDKAQIGNPHPDFTYGLSLEANWKNFDFNMYFYGEQGKQIFNFVKYWTDFNSFLGGKSTRILTNSWTPERGTSATLPIIDDGDTYSSADAHSYYVENGSFLKLKNITLGYTIPMNSKMGIQRLRFYMQAENLFTITKYEGLDPEVASVQEVQNGGGDRARGIDFGTMPITRQFIVGLNLTF